MVRETPEGDPSHVLVVQTVAAPTPRRRKRLAGGALPSEVPLTRLTVIDAVPDAADAGDETSRIADGRRVIARSMTVNRLAAGTADEPGQPPEPIAVRIGTGTGAELADGRWSEAVELPVASQEERRRRRGSPREERFAAMLGGRFPTLSTGLIAQRARADLDAGRPAEAALMLDAALRTAATELTPDLIGEDRREQLAVHRTAVAAAAEAAAAGHFDQDAAAAVEAALERLEAALRAARSGQAESTAASSASSSATTSPPSR